MSNIRTSWDDYFMKIAMIVAERIKKSVEGLALKKKVTVSIGVAQCTTHNTNRYELIQRADTALSIAKKSGKNVVHHNGD